MRGGRCVSYGTVNIGDNTIAYAHTQDISTNEKVVLIKCNSTELPPSLGEPFWVERVLLKLSTKMVKPLNKKHWFLLSDC